MGALLIVRSEIYNNAGMDIRKSGLQGITTRTGNSMLVVSYASNLAFARSPLRLTLLNPHSPEGMLDSNTPRYVIIRAQNTY